MADEETPDWMCEHGAAAHECSICDELESDRRAAQDRTPLVSEHLGDGTYRFIDPQPQISNAPSQAAVEAVLATYVSAPLDPPEANLATMTERLKAAHDPALGLDRSICLRDVVEALRDHAESLDVEPRTPSVRAAVRATYDAATFLEREL